MGFSGSPAIAVFALACAVCASCAALTGIADYSECQDCEGSSKSPSTVSDATTPGSQPMDEASTNPPPPGNDASEGQSDVGAPPDDAALDVSVSPSDAQSDAVPPPPVDSGPDSVAPVVDAATGPGPSCGPLASRIRCSGSRDLLREPRPADEFVRGALFLRVERDARLLDRLRLSGIVADLLRAHDDRARRGGRPSSEVHGHEPIGVVRRHVQRQSSVGRDDLQVSAVGHRDGPPLQPRLRLRVGHGHDRWRLLQLQRRARVLVLHRTGRTRRRPPALRARCAARAHGAQTAIIAGLYPRARR